MASQVNLNVDQGSDYTINLELKNDDNTAFDLSNYSVRGQFKKSYGTSNSHEFTVTIANATSGSIDVTVNAATSNSVAYGRYVYDIEAYTDSLNKRVLQGLLIINPEV